MTNQERRALDTAWMRDARFGMFIHWGLYAIPARGEWVRSKEQMPEEQYMRYFHEFDASDYDPQYWAKLAKHAGMKYAVFTTKHHDGFCLFDSALTEYKSTNTPAGRDLVAEFVNAFRAEGLKIGLYYSLNDWHHDQYPAYGDANHPMRNNKEYKKPYDFEQYIRYYQGQLKELLTNYGKIDMIWFDGVYDEMIGEVWHASETEQMIRTLQPGIVINDRLCLNLLTEDPENSSGDFYTPELMMPSQPVMDKSGNEVMWECCLSLNGLWGYDQSAKKYMNAGDAIRLLVECVSKGGNLLLNVGPDSKGRIPKKCIDILTEIGEWMRDNHASIHQCTRADYPKPEWGRLTQNGHFLYAHILHRTMGMPVLPNIKHKVKKARFLCDGVEVRLNDPWNAKYAQGENNLFLNINTFDLPDDYDTVVELELL